MLLVWLWVVLANSITGSDPSDWFMDDLLDDPPSGVATSSPPPTTPSASSGSSGGNRTIVSVTWVFGRIADIAEFHSHYGVKSGLAEGTGYIRLQAEESWLELDAVKRPEAWPPTRSFCTALLPAAVMEFYAESGLDVRKLKSVYAPNNAGRNPGTCACYAKVMVTMGFRVLGDKVVRAWTDIPAICAIHSEFLVGTLHPSTEMPPQIPEVHEDAFAGIRRAKFFKFVRSV